MKVLVTGGSGFIGSSLVRKLSREGHGVTVLDNLRTGYVTSFNHGSDGGAVSFARGDVRDVKFVRECVKNVDWIVHLAAITSVPYSTKNPEETYEVNAIGTANLLQAAVESSVERFVFASSCAVYGEAKCLPISEDHPLDASSPYGVSKIAGEKSCRAFHEKYGLRTVSLRLFNVYGQRADNSGNDSVITEFVERVRKARRPVIYGDGEQTRDFIHVDDAVGAIVWVLGNGEPREDVYNVGSGRAVTVNWLAKTFFRIAEREWQRPIYRPRRPGDVRHSQADISRLTKELGFKPNIELEEGLDKIFRCSQEELELGRALNR